MYKIDGETAVLVGWRAPSLEGDVVVPALVTSGVDSYAVTSIGEADASEGVFAGSSVESVSLPASVMSVADGALSDCPTLASVAVGSKNESLASFDGMLFTKDLSELLSIPEGKEGVARIPDQTVTVSALSHCAGLAAVEVGEGSAAFSSRDGLLYTKDMNTLVACPPGAGDAVVVPEGVESIGSGAFAGCPVASIMALGFVREIAADAFDAEARAGAVVAMPAGEDYDERKAVWKAAGFSSFKEPAKPGDVSVPEPSEPEAPQASGLAYEVLYDYTLAVSWQGAEGPEGVLEIPATAEVGGVSYRVSAIADAAFAGRSGLTGVALPASVAVVGDRAFEATGLAEAWLPASVATVGERAFAACASLERVVALGSPWVADSALAECSGVSVYAPSDSGNPWNVGLPAAGNHLLPYGVDLPEEPLQLEVGQSADLLEGGQLDAPDPIEASYSYAAKPLSVDPDGTATGKAEGSSEVTVALSLDGVELALATRSIEVFQPQQAEESETSAQEEASVVKAPVEQAQVNKTVPLTSEDEDLSVTALAVGSTFSQGNLAYTVLADNEVSIKTRYAPYGGTELSVPEWVVSGGVKYRVTQIAEEGFYNSATLTSVTLPSSITSIEQGAFSSCLKLSTVTIGGKTSLNRYAFMNCTALKDIYVGGTVPSIDSLAFYRVTASSVTMHYASGAGTSAWTAAGFTNVDSTMLITFPFSLGIAEAYSSKAAPSAQIVPIRTAGKLVKPTANPSVSGFSFVGWFYESNMNMEFDFEKGYVSPITITAKWTRNKYAIVFDGNGSTSGNTASMDMEYGLSQNLTANGFSRDGYMFAGWNTAKDGSGIDYAPGASVKDLTTANNGSFTLYAQWKEFPVFPVYPGNGQTLYYKALSVEGTEGTAVAVYDSRQNVHGYALDLPGRATYDGVSYTLVEIGDGFDGPWSTYLNIPDSVTTLGSALNQTGITSLTLGKNIELIRAGFMKNNALTDVYVNGDIDGISSSIFNGGANKTGGTIVFHISEGVDPAPWVAAGFTVDAPRTVSYSTQGGSAIAQSTVNYGDKVSQPANPTKSGYSFSGWYKDAGCTQVWNFSNETVTSDVTLYAKWTLETYGIAYDLAGGAWPAGTTPRVNYNLTSSSYTLPTPTKTGYAFAGWTGTGIAGGPNKSVTVASGSTGDRSYKANWTANTYTVAYNGNGSASGSTASQTFTYDVSSTLAANGFSKTGYSFMGWNTKADGSGVSYAAGSSQKNLATSGTFTLYAQWAANSYKVHFNAVGGTGTMADQTLLYDAAETALAKNTFVKTGHAFAGWSTSSSAATVSYTDGAAVKNMVPSGTVQLYAVWIPIEYNVTFDSRGGTVVDPQKVEYGAKVSKPAPDPTRTGYSFAGWYKEADCRNAWSFDAMTVSGALTLYAKWTANTYTVAFEANGGTGFMANQTFTYGVPKALSKNIFDKPGYTFSGWNTKANGSGTRYDDEASVSTLAAIGTVSLYAQWTANSYTVKFDGNGSTSGSMSNLAMAYGTPKALTANGFSRTGYSFAGWAKSSAGAVEYANGASVDKLATVAGATVTLYAKWTPNAYTIKFDGNGSTSGATATMSMTYDQAKDLNANGFVKEGYSFAGWAKSSSGAVEYVDKRNVVNLASEPNATVTLYAKWSPNAYTVEYDGNGSTSGSTASQTFTYDASSNLAANGFSKTGYTFVAWNKLSNGTGASYGAGSSQKNLATSGTVKLFAQWKANAYKVRFNANGGDGSMADQAFVYDATETSLAANAFSKDGHTFAGWATSAQGRIEHADRAAVRNLTSEANGVVELFAIWTANEYNVTFDAQGGSAVAAQKIEYGGKVSKPSPDPSKTGYSFAGWYKEADCHNAWSFDAMTVSGALTLYAKWTPNAYTVAFDGNGSTGGSTGSLSMTYGQAKALTANGFSRTGYEFAGWTKDRAGSGAKYEDGQSVINLTESGTVTLYAQWSPVSYRVAFDANGGSGIMPDQNMMYDASATLAPNSFTREGYTFNGWALSSEGNVAHANEASVKNLASTANATVVLYAIWIPNAYTLSFDSQGGSAVDGVNAAFGSKPAAPSNPTKTGYAFAGWYKEAACENAWRFGVDVMPAENVTLYAKWTLVISVQVPAAATVTIDATGAASSSGSLAFTSSSVEPLKVTAIASTEESGAAQVIPNEAARRNTKVTVTPGGGDAVSLELAGSLQEASLTGFTIPKEGSLPLTFGLDLPEGSTLNYHADVQAVARLEYEVSAT